MGGLLDFLSSYMPGLSAPPGGYAPTQNVFGATRPFGLGAPTLASPAAAASATVAPLAPPGQTPLPRDATGDAQPAAYAPPADVAFRGPNQMLKGNAYGYAGASPAPLANAPGTFGGGQLGADRRAVLGIPALAPPAAPVTPAATPTPSATPAAAAVAGGGARGGFRFHDLSPLAAQAIAAFLPRQRMPIEDVQQNIVDMANRRLKGEFDKLLGAPPTPEQYKDIMDNYEKWTQPVTIGPGLPQIMANQYGGGVP